MAHNNAADLAPMEEANAVVIERVRSVLTPAALDRTIDKALKLLAQRQHEQRDAPERLEAEARKLRREAGALPDANS